ncbi:MAG: hypothetical protein IJB34_01380 [Clostridia bacterium]|nr:hypothetical protein [Clostridia bacterium]
MAKTGKRILAVVILILTVLLVGCLIFTGNRLANYPEDIDGYKRVVFEGKDNTMVAFTEDGAWYGAGENEVILLEITDYSEGVITMNKSDLVYRFVAIDADTIYDENSKNLLTRRSDGG